MESGVSVLADRGTKASKAADDAALMARVAARDGVAFRQLAEAHGIVMRRIAYRMLNDVTEAEDVAQEAFLRLWQSAPRWRETGSGVGGWLNRVTTNLCLDRLRRRRFTSDEAAPDRADDAPAADQMMENDQQRALVVRCIDTLSPRQRAAIVLTYYEELPNQAAADALEMNIKAFESLLFRARQTMRNALVAAGVVPAEGDPA